MERRKKIRLRIDKDVRINGSVVAEGLDLSEGGMYVYVSHNFVVGSIVDLGFSLGNEYINVSAKVLHSQPGIGFGVNFFDFPEEIKQKIESYVAGLADDNQTLKESQ
jgi:Tfp pilus assembly protein PilZ